MCQMVYLGPLAINRLTSGKIRIINPNRSWYGRTMAIERSDVLSGSRPSACQLVSLDHGLQHVSWYRYIYQDLSLHHVSWYIRILAFIMSVGTLGS
jgi:hypothetical protein